MAGTKHKKVQENLPEKANSLTSTKLPTYEATLSQMKELDRERKEDIHGIKGDENVSDNKAKTFLNCGLELPLQPRKKCSAYGTMCLNCQKENHWPKFAAPETKEEQCAGKRAEKPQYASLHSRN